MSNTTTPLQFDLARFKVVKFVTRPLLKLIDNQKYYIKIDEPMKVAEQVKNPKKDADGKPVPPPTIVNIVDLSDGHAKQMVANEVLKTELDKQYTANGYVGKYFEIVKNTKAEGKRYNTFGITELEPVEEEKTPAPATPAPAKTTGATPAPGKPTAVAARGK